jgi:ATP-dependent Lhr-like helicase
VLDEIESRLQATDPDYQARHADAVHDLLLKLGDLTRAEIEVRCMSPEVAGSIDTLVSSRRVLEIRIAGERRCIPIEYAGRYRDALGIPMPPGVPDAFLEAPPNALAELVRRYARTHGPFTTQDVGRRFGITTAAAQTILASLHAGGSLYEGEFRPGGVHREWVDPDVLQQARRRTLAQLRREVVPAERCNFTRFLCRWQGVSTPRPGLDALLDAIEFLQGAPLLVSDLERDILPARVAGYRPEDLDALLASGEVLWVGKEQVGDRDGRIALYIADAAGRLLPPAESRPNEPLSERGQQIIEILRRQGASFFAELHGACGGTYPGDTQDAIWELVWRGLITNDTFHSLRNLTRPQETRAQRGIPGEARPGSPEFLRSLRARGLRGRMPEGRWSLIEQRRPQQAISFTEHAAALAQQILVRYGIVMRESAAAEDISGGWSSIYPALRAMEESGWARRGMFVAGMGAAQFATTAAVDMLRSLKAAPEQPEVVHLAASDPANPYGTLFAWPRLGIEEEAGPHGMARASGASVILVDGELAAFLRRRNSAIRVFLPEEEPARSRTAAALAHKVAEIAIERQERRSGLLISIINDRPAIEHPFARFLEEAGLVRSVAGYHLRRVIPRVREDEPEETSLHA